jgi:hypothetical protein
VIGLMKEISLVKQTRTTWYALNIWFQLRYVISLVWEIKSGSRIVRELAVGYIMNRLEDYCLFGCDAV